tara:strand:- start:55 stop:384 length:330 start_codon:yes stop_codon:yes gene_type:complete
MSKRKHGVASVPISFSTKYYEKLKSMPNRSKYIDDAIGYYDSTVNPRLRGISEEKVRLAEWQRCADFLAAWSVGRNVRYIFENGEWRQELIRKKGEEIDAILSRKQEDA